MSPFFSEPLVQMKKRPHLQIQEHKDQKGWISLTFLFSPSLLVLPDTFGLMQGGACLLGILEPQQHWVRAERKFPALVLSKG